MKKSNKKIFCKVENCYGPHKHLIKGYCSLHYQRLRKTGNLKLIKRTCSVKTCYNKHYGHGFCVKHYKQYIKYGKIPERVKSDPNEIIIKRDHAEIVLYNKFNIEVGRSLIDIDDIQKVNHLKWYLNSDSYVISSVNNKRISLHTLLTNYKKTDHKNRIRSDNRRSNLRSATDSENAHNAGLRSDNTSGFKGVSYDKSSGKYIAQIFNNKKNNNLGRYSTAIEAAKVYNMAAVSLFGAYAYLNDI